MDRLDELNRAAQDALAAYDAAGPFPCVPAMAAPGSEQARLWQAVLDAQDAARRAFNVAYVVTGLR